MPASRQSRYKDRYDKLLGDSLAIVQATDFTSDELSQAAEDAFKRLPGAVMVPIEKIEPNPDNPRHGMDEASMRTLADSIAERGLLQPLVVRRNPHRLGEYLVIAGSRRLLAARLVHGDPDEAVRARAELVPCMIRESSDGDAFADALLENLARADLTRAETMDALLRLHRDFGWSGKYIAKRTGRSQGDISELLSIAVDGELADLVRNDAVKPSTAAIIKRLPKEPRDAAIAELRAGKPLTADEARRRLRAAALPPIHVQPAASGAAVGVSNSIPFGANASDIDASGLPPAGSAAGVSNSIPYPTDASSIDVSGIAVMGRDALEAVRKGAPDLLPGIREQLERIGALAAMVDTGTHAGEAVLAAVKDDLSTAYDRLAAHLKRRETDHA